jgi:hypothetical protein
MNPDIAKNWEIALKALNAAKIAFENSKPDYEIKKELRTAIFYGQYMTKDLGLAGEERLIAADIAVARFNQKFDRLGTRDAIEETIKALKEYHNLVPSEYNLPVPIDC